MAWKPGKFISVLFGGRLGSGLGLGLRRKGTRKIRRMQAPAPAPAAGPFGIVKGLATARIDATGKGGPGGMDGIAARIVSGESIIGGILGIEKDPAYVDICEAAKITTKADCKAKGWFWYEDACHVDLSGIKTEAACTAKGGVWVGGKCTLPAPAAAGLCSMSRPPAQRLTQRLDVGDPNLRKKPLMVR